MRIRFALFLIITLYLCACVNQSKQETTGIPIIKCNSCVKDFKIIRSGKPGLDGMQIELNVYDTIYQLIHDRKIIGFKPIHILMPLYPKGTYPRVEINFDSTNHVLRIGQGTIEFFKYERNEFDSIQKLILKDIIVVLFDKDSNEYKVLPCK